MRKIMLLTASAALISVTPALAQKDHGNKEQGNKDRGNGGKADRDGGYGGGKKQDRRSDKGPDRNVSPISFGNGVSQKAVNKQFERAQKSVRDDVRDARLDVQVREPQIIRDVRGGGRDYGDHDYNGAVRNGAAQLYEVRQDGRLRYLGQRDNRYALIQGCPPGLAQNGNGCLPPGQARKIARAIGQQNQRSSYYDYLSYYPRFQQDNYAYSNGYAYRTGNGGGVSSLITAFLPLVGGALFQGNSWPQQYSAQPVPAYYSNYYGNGDNNGYRYANNTLFGVSPQSQTITSIAGLLTGNDFNVGERIPGGYDAYNIPYNYRDRYQDNGQSQYRYSDGYVYQVDTKTRLIQAAIQLLT